MPIIAIIALLLLFLKSKSTDPPAAFSNSPTDAESITVQDSSFTGTAPKPVQNANGTVTITATITKAKAKTISSQLITEFAELLTEEMDVMNIILQCKNDADYALVYAEFGEHGSGVLTGQLYEGIFAFNPKDLTTWITYIVEDTSQLKRLHQRFPTVF